MKSIFICILFIILCNFSGFGQQPKLPDDVKEILIASCGGFMSSSSLLEGTADITIEQFKKLYELDKAHANTWYQNAKNAKKTADFAYNYIQKLKVVILEQYGLNEDYLNEKDPARSYNPNKYFIEDRHGDQMRDTLKAFLEDMKKLLSPAGTGRVKLAIDEIEDNPYIQGKEKLTWPEFYFKDLPLQAALALLSKFQNDVRIIENKVIDWNFRQVGINDDHFTSLVPMIIPETPVVTPGSLYKADIILGVYNNTALPQIEVNGKFLNEDDIISGAGKYKAIASGSGIQNIEAKIWVKDPKTDDKIAYTATSQYFVSAFESCVSADKMNLLYIGYDNPLSITVPGFKSDQIKVNITEGGNLIQDKKNIDSNYLHCIVKPDGSQREMTVKVSVLMPDSSIRVVGTQFFWIRDLPAPEILFGTKTGGFITGGEISAIMSVNADLFRGGFSTLGLKFEVNSYKLVIAKMNGTSYIEDVTGHRITEKTREELMKVQSGDVIVITNVSVTGPDGKETKNAGVSLVVK